MACTARIDAARVLRMALCICSASCSVVSVACAPDKVPPACIFCSTGAQAPAMGALAPAAVFFKAANIVSSKLSRSSSAFFMCFSRKSAPCCTRLSSATRLASTAFSKAASMPATACSSSTCGSTPAPRFLAAPWVAASDTAFSVLRMFFSDNSRACSAASVAVLTPWRSWAPCLAVAVSKRVISASGSISGLAMAVSLCLGLRMVSPRPGPGKRRSIIPESFPASRAPA